MELKNYYISAEIYKKGQFVIYDIHFNDCLLVNRTPRIKKKKIKKVLKQKFKCDNVIYHKNKFVSTACNN